jgi:hypothetical protein
MAEPYSCCLTVPRSLRATFGTKATLFWNSARVINFSGRKPWGSSYPNHDLPGRATVGCRSALESVSCHAEGSVPAVGAHPQPGDDLAVPDVHEPETLVQPSRRPVGSARCDDGRTAGSAIHHGAADTASQVRGATIKRSMSVVPSASRLNARARPPARQPMPPTTRVRPRSVRCRLAELRDAVVIDEIGLDPVCRSLQSHQLIGAFDDLSRRQQPDLRARVSRSGAHRHSAPHPAHRATSGVRSVSAARAGEPADHSR